MFAEYLGLSLDSRHDHHTERNPHQDSWASMVCDQILQLLSLVAISVIHLKPSTNLRTGTQRPLHFSPLHSD